MPSRRTMKLPGVQPRLISRQTAMPYTLTRDVPTSLCHSLGILNNKNPQSKVSASTEEAETPPMKLSVSLLVLRSTTSD